MRYCFLPAAFDWLVELPRRIFRSRRWTGFFHQVQHAGVGVLGGDFEMAADVMVGQLAHVVGIATGEVHADARGDEDFFDAREFARFFHQVDERSVIGAEQFADGGMDATEAAADGFDLGARAFHFVHVGGGTADVADDAGEVGLGFTHPLDFGEDGFLAAALDDAAFVGGDAAKGTAAEAAAHDLHRMLDDFVGGDFFAAVTGMREARVGEAVDAIHFGLSERECAGIDDDGFGAVELDEALGVVRVGFLVRDFREGAEGAFGGGVFAADLFVGREGDGWQGVWVSGGLVVWCRMRLGGSLALPIWLRLLSTQAVGDAAELAEVFDRGAAGELVGDFDDRALAHAVDEEVALGVEDDRAADFVAPVIVVGESAEAGFDAAGDDGDAFVGFAGALAVGEGCAIGAAADTTARAVGIVVANFAIGRVMVDHRIHVAGADGVEQARAAERAPRLARMPIGLAEDRDAEAFVFEQPAEQGHGETRMIDVGIAGDEDDIDFGPAALVHFTAGHGERRSGRWAVGGGQ